MELALCIVIVVDVLLIGIATRRRRAVAHSEQHAQALAKRGRELHVTRIRDVLEGTVVRITGKVRLIDGWVVAPISRRACAYWRLRISLLEDSAARKGAVWRSVAERSGSCPFVLASGAEQCLVDPKLAAVQLKEGTRFSQYPGRWLPARHRAALAAAGISVERVQRAQVRFEESVLAFDAPSAIVGTGALVQRAPKGAETPYREGLETWMQFDRSNGDLFISDDVRLFRRRGTPVIRKVKERWVSTASEYYEWLPNGGAMPHLAQVERTFARRRRRRIIGIALAGLVVVGSAVFALAFQLG